MYTLSAWANDQKLIYEVQGDLWSDCLSTFGTKRIAEKVKVVDRNAQPPTLYINHAGRVDFNFLYWSAGALDILALWVMSLDK
jgi:hypothetical protein